MSTPVRDRRLTSTPVFDDELIVIAATTHPFAKKTHVKLAEMKGETLLLYPPKEESLVLNQVLLPNGAVPGRIDEVQLTEAIVELVKAGLGVSVMARWAVEPIVKAGALVARPLTARGMHRRWSAVMPKDLAKTDFVKEFVELLKEHSPVRRTGPRSATG